MEKRQLKFYAPIATNLFAFGFGFGKRNFLYLLQKRIENVDTEFLRCDWAWHCFGLRLLGQDCRINFVFDDEVLILRNDPQR